ncbi:MAG TPA: adenylate/guanylate cyclase domain-containing protein [Chitinophagaceae bacterium]|jgi:guanylate cyclase|nr:adenylate/guanylate cyclase domain-containing protein [Chitinophagaceae bacterium]
MTEFIDRSQKIREKSFLRMVPLFALAGLLWSVMYYYYGATAAAMIPGIYSIISFLSLLYYRWYKNYPLFRNIQLVLILLLPFLLHLSLGNIISSSAVILWSTLCPLGALAFYNTKAATYYFILFILVMIAAFVLENKIVQVETKLPDSLVNLLFILNISAVTFLTFYVLRYFVYQNEIVKEQLNKEQELLAIEREKSEKLLLNILPASIADRLKAGEKTIANEYPEVAILFADIVGFTKTTQHIPPARLIENLNKIFTHFDMLVEQYGLEKIKTIGDAYMVVSGLKADQPDHINRITELALKMAGDIDTFSLDGNTKCTIRIGLHIGPVVAGVIGTKKFSYDVWGDAVNTASRMESFSEPGMIQVSENFYEYIKDDYECEFRGKIDIKSKGMMNLYFLKGKRNSY